MIVGIAVETTVDSKEASAETSKSAAVTARRRLGSNRGGVEDIKAKQYSRRSRLLGSWPRGPPARGSAKGSRPRACSLRCALAPPAQGSASSAGGRCATGAANVLNRRPETLLDCWVIQSP